MDPWELIEGLTDALLPEEPRALADRVLATLTKALPVHRAAIFAREQDRMHLYASRSLDQSVLDVAVRVWPAHRDALEAGKVYSASAQDKPPDPAIGRALAGLGALTVVPIRSRDRLLGLLYVASRQPLDAEQLRTIERLARIAGVALKAPGSGSSAAAGRAIALETYLERTTPEAIQRDQLLYHLDKNEWNIARVARILGVTRRTIYLQLERFSIARKHVPKSLPKKREAT